MSNPKIGFIGAGKLGCALGRYFLESGLTVYGYYSRSAASTEQAAAFTRSKSCSLTEVVRFSDLLFLTVPDGQLADAWGCLSCLPLGGKELCHCSGLYTSEVFERVECMGAKAYSLHPLCAIHDICDYEKLHSAFFTLEGPEPGGYLTEILDRAGIRWARIEPEKKALYHAAAVFLSNLANGLVSMGEGMLLSSGLPEGFARGAWRELFLGNASNIARAGPVNALTGPIERCDAASVACHIAALDDPARKVYLLLSRELLKLARLKHPERDFKKVEEVLDA